MILKTKLTAALEGNTIKALVILRKRNVAISLYELRQLIQNIRIIITYVKKTQNMKNPGLKQFFMDDTITLSCSPLFSA